MSTDTNKALVRRYYEEVLNQRDPSLVEELFAPNYAYHIADAPPNLPDGLEGFKKFVTLFLRGYTNLHFTIEDQMERIVDGKIVESWGVFDTSAMLELAGAVPQIAEERH
ncbi:MAG TPA: ester cyclase [Ktedonobacteraceae bacterium]|nr:ester cyclase [Ktedonobacteraceae bacterium]